MTRMIVVGARCSRQGIGEFVTRFLAEEGAEIVAIVGTSEKSAQSAQENLRAKYDIECNAYTNLEQAIQAEPNLDAVALCSPYSVHLEQLKIVAAHKLHCLCEKPLWWPTADSLESNDPLKLSTQELKDLREKSRAITQLFVEQNLLLQSITQWPFTLGAYEQVLKASDHPARNDFDLSEPDRSAIRSFDMLLGPTSQGLAMVIDSAPHLFSLLQGIIGLGTIASVHISPRDPKRELDSKIHFSYQSDLDPSHKVAISLELRNSPSPPRPAGYGINGHFASREIQLPDYAMFFTAQEVKVRLDDPLQLLARDFIANVKAAKANDKTEVDFKFSAAALRNATANLFHLVHELGKCT